ncbi:tetratricopeptide repeat protein [candidate division CSSED10-310 bacterium]|uniref:Tetratricopeptide repeat protein n=1 Tax=candidate division CSSED10-310 bacterium TaxID=2855610 RepID=A0ABV6YTJ9_UNCC1
MKVQKELAKVLYKQGRNKEATIHLEKVITEALGCGYQRERTECLSSLSCVCESMGDFAEALKIAKQALAVSQEGSYRMSEGIILGKLALIYYEEGRIAAAQKLLEQALTIAREVGDRIGETHVLANLALLLHDQDRLEESGLLYEQARERVEHRVRKEQRSASIQIKTTLIIHFPFWFS